MNKQEILDTIRSYKKYSNSNFEFYSDYIYYRIGDNKYKIEVNDNIDKLSQKLKNVEMNIDESKSKLVTTFENEVEKVKTELDNFLKKNTPETVNLLLPALEKEINHKNQLQKSGEFCAPWKKLRRWAFGKSRFATPSASAIRKPWKKNSANASGFFPKFNSAPIFTTRAVWRRPTRFAPLIPGFAPLTPRPADWADVLMRRARRAMSPRKTWCLCLSPWESKREWI